ncbi:MAG: hypothetical protein KC492_10625, partial [Myxococcales bacterium]|nr:hypothetical protein [Myxococcales bacterium]
RCMEILRRLLKEYLGSTEAALLDSGRGAQGWINLGPCLTAAGPMAEGEQAWAHRIVLGCQGWLRHMALDEFVTLDSTHDASRLCRLAGTLNLKSHRVAEWVDSTRGAALTMEHLKAIGLAQTLPVPCDKKSVDAWSGDPPTEEELLRWLGDPHSGRSEAGVIWDQNDGGDRSKRDAKFLLALRAAGCAAEVACRLLGAMPGGKMHDEGRGSDYFNSTLAWADAQCEQVFELRDLVEADDPEALILGSDARYLNALASLDQRSYARTRRDLKAKGVTLGQLDALVKGARKELRAARAGQSGAAGLCSRLRFTTRGGTVVGWWGYVSDKRGWVYYKNKSDVPDFVRSLGYEDPKEAMAEVMQHPFELVDVPFGPEHPEPDAWNRTGAQLAVEPAQGDWDTWRQMFEHLGQSLDQAVAS